MKAKFLQTWQEKKMAHKKLFQPIKYFLCSVLMEGLQRQFFLLESWKVRYFMYFIYIFKLLKNSLGTKVFANFLVFCHVWHVRSLVLDQNMMHIRKTSDNPQIYYKFVIWGLSDIHLRLYLSIWPLQGLVIKTLMKILRHKSISFKLQQTLANQHLLP